MAVTVLDIITGAAKLLGVVFKNEALSSDEANDGLVALNDLLDTWSNDTVTTITHTLENFTLTGATSYTMGTGGNFNTTRPLSIATAVVRIGTVDYPLQIISQEQYQTEIAVKSITSSIPQFLTYDSGYPLTIIKMYPVPASGGVLYLQTDKPLSNLSALTTTVDLPPGWKRALKYNLAIDLAPQYGVQVPPEVVEVAKSSLGSINRASLISRPLPFIPSDGTPYSIYTGTPG